jgi:hypothetical protein
MLIAAFKPRMRTISVLPFWQRTQHQQTNTRTKSRYLRKEIFQRTIESTRLNMGHRRVATFGDHDPSCTVKVHCRCSFPHRYIGEQRACQHTLNYAIYCLTRLTRMNCERVRVGRARLHCRCRTTTCNSVYTESNQLTDIMREIIYCSDLFLQLERATTAVVGRRHRRLVPRIPSIVPTRPRSNGHRYRHHHHHHHHHHHQRRHCHHHQSQLRTLLTL